MVELATWFANVEYLLVRVQRQMIGRKLTVSDARCWPQHRFEFATLISLRTRETDVTGYVGFIPNPTLRRYRACRSPLIGIHMSSPQLLRQLIRWWRLIKSTRLMNS
jgi:hypothetical protein